MDSYKYAFPSVVPASFSNGSPQINYGLSHEELMTLVVMHALLSNTNFAPYNVSEIGQQVRRVVDGMKQAL